MSGVHTPPKSGSFAMACQSLKVGGGLVGSFPAAANAAGAAMLSNNSARKEWVFMRLKITRSPPRVARLFEAHREAPVNSCMAFKILRNGRGARVFDGEICKRTYVQLEARVIGRKHQAAGWTQ